MTDKVELNISNDLGVERTADVVSAYVANNVVPPNDLADLIANVHAALKGLERPSLVVEKPVPAVNPKRAIKPDHIICLDCGKSFKSLRRHLAANHDMTPDEYRAKWELGADYPLVAPNYAEQRSELAKSLGLGRKPGRKPKTRAKK